MVTRKTTTTKRGKGAADNATGDAPVEVRSVSYVVNRPYSAGEHFDIITAYVKKEHEDDADVLDLAVEPGAAATFKGVRRSDAREPGTWHETPPEAPAAEEGAE